MCYLYQYSSRCDHPCLLTPAIILPDYNADTVWSLIELLKAGSTTVMGHTQRMKVSQLQRDLYCGFSMGSSAHNTSIKPRIREKWIIQNEVICVLLYNHLVL